ncbi:MAG TPA: AzlC family ABC transporter permease [Euzebyales bacterium]
MSTAVYDRLDASKELAVVTAPPDVVTRAPETTVTREGMRAGLRDMAPMTVAIAPFAMVLGVAIGASVVPDLLGAVMAPVLYAGSANFAAIAVLDAGGTAFIAALTAIVVNIRFMMYGAALAGRFDDQPRWFRWLGPWFIIDQLFALASSRDEQDPVWFRAYWLSAAALIGGIFTAMVVVGILLGPVLPTGAGLQFTVPAMFLALLVGQLRDRPALVAAIAGAGVTALALDLPHGLGLMAGAVAGAAAGAITRRMS